MLYSIKGKNRNQPEYFNISNCLRLTMKKCFNFIFRMVLSIIVCCYPILQVEASQQSQINVKEVWQKYLKDEESKIVANLQAVLAMSPQMWQSCIEKVNNLKDQMPAFQTNNLSTLQDEYKVAPESVRPIQQTMSNHGLNPEGISIIEVKNLAKKTALILKFKADPAAQYAPAYLLSISDIEPILYIDETFAQLPKDCQEAAINQELVHLKHLDGMYAPFIIHDFNSSKDDIKDVPQRERAISILLNLLHYFQELRATIESALESSDAAKKALAYDRYVNSLQDATQMSEAQQKLVTARSEILHTIYQMFVEQKEIKNS